VLRGPCHEPGWRGDAAGPPRRRADRGARLRGRSRRRAGVAAAFRWHEGRVRLGIPIGIARVGGRVAIVVDEGWFWWDLRAFLARGALVPSLHPDGAGSTDLAWFELAADRVTAWDYGRLHEEP